MTPLSLNATQAARMLSVSRSHFYEHIAPQLPRVYSGRKRLYRVSTLERWLERNETATEVRR